jgi:hypothetical protein
MSALFCFLDFLLFIANHDSSFASRWLSTRISWPGDGGRSCRSIGAGLAKAALAGKSMARWLIPVFRSGRQPAVHHHRQGRRWAGSHSPLHGPLAGLCREGAVPGGAGHHRPGDRKRLLLRLFLQAPLHARRPGGHREEDGELAAKDEPVTRRVLPRDEAVAYFKGLGEHYKAEIIASIPADEDVSLYREGKFEDLCRGPHVPSTGKLKHFKLMKVAGAYWRGDHRNEMLQRVYGTAWATKDELQQYLTMLEEAEKRDHRKLGANWICSTSTNTRPARCSGTPRAGRSGRRSSSTCAASTATTATRRSRARRFWTRLWEKTGTGTSTATTCSRPSRRSATTRSSR